MNLFVAEAVRERRARQWTWDWYHAECAALETPEKAIAALQASAAELTAAMQSLTDDQLQTEVALAFGPGMQVTVQQMLFFPYWNMTYHQGQLAYIQTLYGDREMYGMS